MKRDRPSDVRGVGTAHEHALLLARSYRHWTGRPLLALPPSQSPDPEALARALFEAPFAVLSHGVETDPILNYGNRFAVDLWETTYEELVALPSRCTAAPVEQGARERFMEQVQRAGFVDDYEGGRVSRTGRRFRIERATVWNLIDDRGDYRGQAATFPSYRFED